MSAAELPDDVAAPKALLAATRAALAAPEAALAERTAALARVEEARRRLELIVDDELRREEVRREVQEARRGAVQPAARRRRDRPRGAGRRPGGGRRDAGGVALRPAAGQPQSRAPPGAHLPRLARAIAPASTLCPCGCGPMARSGGDDVAERLDVVPAQFRVLVTRRPRCACRRRSGAVVQAHAPEHVVPGGRPPEALIAHVAGFGDHPPFYRQSEIDARQGVALDRATLGAWTGRACFHLLQPVVGRMRAHLGRAERLFMDETTAPVLDPGRGRTRTGYFWAIAADDRGRGGADPPVVVFRDAPGRSGAHAEGFLDGFSGRLLRCDGCDRLRPAATAATAATG